MKKKHNRIENRIERQSNAFKKALDYCQLYGVDWHTNIQPIIENKEIIGYWVIDETFSTTVAEVLI